MITANGKNVINRFYARQLPQIGASVSFGVGSTAPTVNDTKLQYEVVRVPLLSLNVDPAGDRIVFRCQLPAGRIRTIHEVALWSEVDVSPNSLNLTSNPSGTWTNGTLTNQNSRAGANAIQISYTASGTTNAETSGFMADASRFVGIDSIVIGYYVTVNLSSLRVRIGSDSANYFEFLLPAGTANSYNVARLALSSATKTGSPSWNRLTYLAVRPSATASGGGNVFFDGIRFESNNVSNTNVMVARTVLATPFSPDPTIESDIEYALKVAIT